MIVSVFLPIGPCGQGAFGLLQLANVLRNLSRTASGTNGDSPGNADIGGLGGLYSAGEIQVMASAVYGCSIMCVSPCLTPCDAKWGEAKEKNTLTSLETLLFYGALDYFGSSMP